MRTLLILLLSTAAGLVQITAQTVSLKTDQDPLVMKVGETKKLNMVAVDENGTAVDSSIYFYEILREEGFVPTSGAQVDSLGNITGACTRDL